MTETLSSSATAATRDTRGDGVFVFEVNVTLLAERFGVDLRVDFFAAFFVDDGRGAGAFFDDDLLGAGDFFDDGLRGAGDFDFRPDDFGVDFFVDFLALTCIARSIADIPFFAFFADVFDLLGVLRFTMVVWRSSRFEKVLTVLFLFTIF